MDENMKELKIAVIVEGNEEECLFSIAKETGHFNSALDIEIINAGGEGNVPAFFQDYYSNPVYDCAVAVYDVDNKCDCDSSIYSITKNKLEEIVGEKVNTISFCTNPNILQILLLGCDEIEKVSLNSTSKANNEKLVSSYWPKISKKIKDGMQIKKGYDASEYQLEIIKNSFLYEEEPSYDYKKMLDNASKLPLNYEKMCPSSNVQILLRAIDDGDINFFENIIEKTKKEI